VVLDIKQGDVLRLKKKHPCGSYLWQVVRLGADIGIKCQVCGRRVLMGRSTLERRVKQVTPSQEESPEENDSNAGGLT
jgi:hypothetical protein